MQTQDIDQTMPPYASISDEGRDPASAPKPPASDDSGGGFMSALGSVTYVSRSHDRGALIELGQLFRKPLTLCEHANLYQSGNPAPDPAALSRFRSRELHGLSKRSRSRALPVVGIDLTRRSDEVHRAAEPPSPRDSRQVVSIRRGSQRRRRAGRRLRAAGYPDDAANRRNRLHLCAGIPAQRSRLPRPRAPS